MCGYYKQPLREIKESSANALFGKAKKMGKNYISMVVQKHSGTSFNLGFNQDSLFYKCFLDLSYEASKNIKINFLNSLMYKLEDHKMVIEAIANDKEALANFFANNFNEVGHKAYKHFFEKAGELIQCLFTEQPTASLNKKMESLYGAFRFVHFINAADVTE